MSGNRRRLTRRARPRRRRKLRSEWLEPRHLLAVTAQLVNSPDWVDQGPTSVSDTRIVGLGDNSVAGAVQAVAPHPDDANIMYIGAASGGIWWTTKAKAADPEWQPLTDQQPSLSIVSLEYDPDNRNILYAGTGNVTNGARNELTGIGVYKITRSGNKHTIKLLGSRSPATPGSSRARGLSGLQIHSVVPMHEDDVIFVAAEDSKESRRGVTTGATSKQDRGGIFRSNDGGNTWQRISGMKGLPKGTATDLVWEKSSNILWAAIPGFGKNNSTAGVYYSTDGGTTWKDASLPDKTHIKSTVRIDLAIGGTKSPLLSLRRPNVFAALIVKSAINNGTLKQIFGDYSSATSKTVHWRKIGEWPDQKLLQFHVGSQGKKNFAMAADPIDSNVFIGGDRLNRLLGLESFPCADDTDEGSVFRYDIEFSSTSQSHRAWRPVVCNAANDTAPHPDSRAMAFDRDGNLIQVDDGGVYKLTHPNDYYPVIGAKKADNTFTLKRVGLSPTNISVGATITVFGDGASGKNDGEYKVTDVSQIPEIVVEVDPAVNAVSNDLGDFLNPLPPAPFRGRLTPSFWSSLNKGLAVTEVYSAAYDSKNDLIIAGTQDNGTIRQKNSIDHADNTAWTAISGGDGVAVAVDTASKSGDKASLHYVDSLNPNSPFRYLEQRLYDGSESPPEIADSKRNAQSQTTTGHFVWFDPQDRLFHPFELNADDPKNLLLATCGVYEMSNTSTESQLGTVKLFGDRLLRVQTPSGHGWGCTRKFDKDEGYNNIDQLAYGAGGMIYASQGRHLAVRVDGPGGKLLRINSPPGVSEIRGIVINPDDLFVFYIIDKTNVYRGALSIDKLVRNQDKPVSWTTITGNIRVENCGVSTSLTPRPVNMRTNRSSKVALAAFSGQRTPNKGRTPGGMSSVTGFPMCS